VRKFAIVFLSAAGICGPFAANAALVQNTPPVISVSDAPSYRTTCPTGSPWRSLNLAAAGAEHSAERG
jgi:hypothetical protein